MVKTRAGGGRRELTRGAPCRWFLLSQLPDPREGPGWGRGGARGAGEGRQATRTESPRDARHYPQRRARASDGELRHSPGSGHCDTKQLNRKEERN